MPSVTKAFLDTFLVDRTADLLALWNLPVVKDGTNPATIDPITVALGSIGIEPLTWGVIVQADLDGVGSGKAWQVLDLAEYRLLQTLHSRALAMATVRVGTQSEVDWGGVAANIAAKLRAVKAEIDAKYMSDLSGLVAGRIRLNTTNRTTAPGCVEW